MPRRRFIYSRKAEPDRRDPYDGLMRWPDPKHSPRVDPSMVQGQCVSNMIYSTTLRWQDDPSYNWNRRPGKRR